MLQYQDINSLSMVQAELWCRVGNAAFARVFSWLVATKYAVYHAGDPLATSAATDGLQVLGHIINISPDHADMAEIKGYALLQS